MVGGEGGWSCSPQRRGLGNRGSPAWRPSRGQRRVGGQILCERFRCAGVGRIASASKLGCVRAGQLSGQRKLTYIPLVTKFHLVTPSSRSLTSPAGSRGPETGEAELRGEGIPEGNSGTSANQAAAPRSTPAGAKLEEVMDPAGGQIDAKPAALRREGLTCCPA